MKRRFKVNVDGKDFTVEVEEIPGEAARTPPTITATPTPEAAPRAPAAVTKPIEKPATVALEVPAGEGVVTAPLSGIIQSIHCKVNDKVKEGDLLLTLEAMKMENEVFTTKSGTVKKIHVSDKQKVNYGDILVEIE